MDRESDERSYQELVAEAQGGDSEAFALIYDQYLTPVYRYIYFRVRHKETAEDLTQTVFLKAWEKMRDFEERGVVILSWLYTIARNQVIDHWKKKRDVTASDPDELFAALHDERLDTKKEIDRADIARVLAQEIAELSELQQQVVVLRYLEELSYSEIAQLTEKSEESLRALNHRALTILRERLNDYRLE